jgi:hypothetical protein
VDQRIASIANLQRGRVARRQLIAAGIPPRMVARLVAAGKLWPRHAGVYVVGHNSEVEFGRETAALLAFTNPAGLCLHSAAHIWRLRPAALDAAVDVIFVENRSGGRRQGIHVHRSTILQARDIRIRERLPVTSPARTLLDLADVLTPRQLAKVLDEALATRIVTMQQIEELLTRAGTGRLGAPILKALLNDRARGRGPSGSRDEDRMYELIIASGLPIPQRNAPVGVYRLDFLWPHHHVALEVDGYPWHTTKTAFERDHRKDAAMKSTGIDLTRVTPDQITEEPLAIIAGLAKALTRADAA